MLGKSSKHTLPNGGFSWWFTMVQSVKNRNPSTWSKFSGDAIKVVWNHLPGPKKNNGADSNKPMICWDRSPWKAQEPMIKHGLIAATKIVSKMVLVKKNGRQPIHFLPRKVSKRPLTRMEWVGTTVRPVKKKGFQSSPKNSLLELLIIGSLKWMNFQVSFYCSYLLSDTKKVGPLRLESNGCFQK